MDFKDLNKQLVEFPISVGLYGEFRNRIWLGLIRTELLERVGFNPKNPKIGDVDQNSPMLSYITDLKQLAGGNAKSIVIGEYIFGIMNAMTGEVYPERIVDLLEVFSDRVHEQVKMSTPEGESPSLLYYSWFEFAVYDMVKSVIEEESTDNSKLKSVNVENMVANLKCLANTGKRLCHAAANNLHFRNHIQSLLPENKKYIMNESTINRGLIIYDSINSALKVRVNVKDRTIKRSSYEMGSSFFSSDTISVNDHYSSSTTIIGSSKLIRKISDVQNAMDSEKLKEIKSLVSGFKGLIQDAV